MRKRPRRPRPVARRGRQGHGQARPRAREALMPCRSSPRPTCRPAGEAASLAGETHEGSDYAGFPGIPRGRYPKGDLMRIVPGDVSTRTPAKARRYLPYVPGRLEFVSAPRHSSRPDLTGSSSRGQPAGHRAASGYPAGTSSRRGSCVTSRRRAPSRSSTGGGGTCRS